MSSHKNKAIRERLERIYGKGCMFQKAHIAQRIEEIGGIKTYKQYIQQHKYSFKKVKKLEEFLKKLTIQQLLKQIEQHIKRWKLLYII